MIDVDLIISSGFTNQLLTNATRLSDILSDAESGSVLVPPAFEATRCSVEGCRDGVVDGVSAAHGSKERVVAMFQAGALDAFHCAKGFHYINDLRR